MPSFQDLLTASYWFADPGATSSPMLKVIGGAFAGLFLAGLVCHFLFKKKDLFHPALRKLFLPLPGRMMRWGALGVALAFFRWEGAHYLSWRFWWAVFAAWVLFASVRGGREFLKEKRRRLELFERTRAEMAARPAWKK